MKLKISVAEKVAWVRTHPLLSLAISCSSFLLFLPRVQSLLIFFWPLLLSTALFVTALLTIGDTHKLDEDSLRVDDSGGLDTVTAHCEENGHEEVGECSGSTQIQHSLERQRSLIDYVVEQHEGSIVHFDSLFQDPPEGGLDLTAKGEEDQRQHQVAES